MGVFRFRINLKSLLVFVALLAPTETSAATLVGGFGTSSVELNDNRRPAGERRGESLYLALRAGRGLWQPQGADAPAVQVEAFGEVNSTLQVPAPLIRAREHTLIIATIRNDLDSTLQVHGLCTRGSAPCNVLNVPAGETREVSFASGPSGTYYYWATTTGMALTTRGSIDAQFSGALVVDPAAGATNPDRVLVITEWTSLTPAQLAEVVSQPDPGAAFLHLRPKVLYAVNGRSWPNTERLAYNLGERARWRVLNLSTQAHPMHLHGFYFDVERQGDEGRDEAVPTNQRIHEVTHLMAPGSTVSMVWTPERIGNWLFHCHTMLQVSPTLNVDGTVRSQQEHGHDGHLAAGMTGLVVGIVVRGSEGRSADLSAIQKERRLTLIMRQEPRRFADAPAFGFQLAEGSNMLPSGPLPVPGPVLVLRRGEPVVVTLVNQLPEATSIHWHGMELESYYDGVHGWSGSEKQATPSIGPGESFLVRFTPPRAGTFIYHSHLHDNRQLTSGLYGAMLVLEPDQVFDETVDHVFVLGRGGPALDAPAVINGNSAPQVVWTASQRHRVRLINITPNDILNVSLRTPMKPVLWHPLAKDGANLPNERSAIEPAAKVIAVGETYDFEYEAPPGRQSLWLEARSPSGKWLAQAQVIFK